MPSWIRIANPDPGTPLNPGPHPIQIRIHEGTRVRLDNIEGLKSTVQSSITYFFDIPEEKHVQCTMYLYGIIKTRQSSAQGIFILSVLFCGENRRYTLSAVELTPFLFFFGVSQFSFILTDIVTDMAARSTLMRHLMYFDLCAAVFF